MTVMWMVLTLQCLSQTLAEVDTAIPALRVWQVSGAHIRLRILECGLKNRGQKATIGLRNGIQKSEDSSQHGKEERVKDREHRAAHLNLLNSDSCLLTTHGQRTKFIADFGMGDV